MTFIIRPSSLPMFFDCARRQAARSFPVEIVSAGYQLRQIASSVGASVGTATHSAVASCMTAKMATGELGNQSEDEDRGVEEFGKQISYGVSWDATTPNAGTGKRQVVRQYRAYRGTTANRVIPIAVEQRIECRTRRGNVLSGGIDLTDDGIRDLKTGVTARSNLAQYGCYSMLVRAGGRSVQHIIEDYIARVKVDDEQPAPVEIAYDVALAERVAANAVARVEQMYDEFIATGDNMVFPANPNSVLCADKFCPCRHTDFCMEYRR